MSKLQWTWTSNGEGHRTSLSYLTLLLKRTMEIDDLKASQLDLYSITNGGTWLLCIMSRRPAVCTYYEPAALPLPCGSPVDVLSLFPPRATALSHTSPPLSCCVSDAFILVLTQYYHSLSHRTRCRLSLCLTRCLCVSLVVSLLPVVPLIRFFH